ncbi:MAG TPA: glycerophosphodiester phosphodiesterase family protein [Spirochaetota bacterium]|nr:glycerophosphodiester phosphodiesterase family protein [Spirochaetota bacterium]
MSMKETRSRIPSAVKSVIVLTVLFLPHPTEKSVGESSFSIISHRGTAYSAPENTLPAFEGAVRERADMIEFDIRATKDDILIVMHDSTLDRTTDACARWNARHIPVNAKTFADIRSLDASEINSAKFARYRGTRVPSFVEALEMIEKNSVALVHRKSGDARLIAADIFRHGFTGKTVVQSEDVSFLRDMHLVAPDVPLGWIAGEDEFRHADPAVLKKAGIMIIAFDNKTVTAGTLDVAMREGFRVFVYTIDRYAEGVRMAQFGLDGIVTDFPLRMRTALLKNGVKME